MGEVKEDMGGSPLRGSALASGNSPNPSPGSPAGAALSATFVGAGRKAKCPSNPAYPNGMDVDIAGEAPGCTVQLDPYPAPECGHWLIKCPVCGHTAAITAAGRPDDARSVRIPCNLKGSA
jgi:hypothetical protein